MTRKLILAALTGLLLGGASSAVLAADSVRVRGEVVDVNGSTLEVKTREGENVGIKLAEGWQIGSVAKASVSEIKVGDFVGVASLPKAEGGDGALEIVIFPAAMKGAGEGTRTWDLKPNSSMTNATVADAVKGVDGPTLTLAYKGGEKKVSIGPDTPIVTLAPATPADLKPGARVFVPAERGADGILTAKRVVVGTNGVVPPM